jgi:hypothetical protein
MRAVYPRRKVREGKFRLFAGEDSDEPGVDRWRDDVGIIEGRWECEGLR